MHREKDDLTLEITESAYTGDSDQVISTAKELRGMDRKQQTVLLMLRHIIPDFSSGYERHGED